MGVDRTDYIMIGANITHLGINFYDNFDKWQPYLEGWHDVKYSIVDTQPMGGDNERWIFGLVIDQGDKYEGIEFNSFSEHDYISEKTKMEEKAHELGLYNDEYSIGEEDFKIIVFTQWH